MNFNKLYNFLALKLSLYRNFENNHVLDRCEKLFNKLESNQKLFVISNDNNIFEVNSRTTREDFSVLRKMNVIYSIFVQGENTRDNNIKSIIDSSKSSSIEVAKKWISENNMWHLFLPAFKRELAEIMSYDVFYMKENYSKEEFSQKYKGENIPNIISSRIVFTLKFDRVSGLISKAKCRFVARGSL